MCRGSKGDIGESSPMVASRGRLGVMIIGFTREPKLMCLVHAQIIQCCLSLW